METTRAKTYAKLRDSSRPSYSHSIISSDVSSLIWKHKSSNLTDKCRRYTRRKFLILNSQENFEGFENWCLQHLSESIGALDGPQARNGLLLCFPRLAADTVIGQSDRPLMSSLRQERQLEQPRSCLVMLPSDAVTCKDQTAHNAMHNIPIEPTAHINERRHPTAVSSACERRMRNVST